MTTASIALGTGYAVGPWVDRGLSEDAEALRRSVASAFDFGNSFSLGERRRCAGFALAKAFAEAAVANWDGVGSAAAEVSTYAHANRFLESLPSTLPIPDVSVDRDGEICFDWDNGPRQVFTVCVGRDGTLTYAGLFGFNRIHGVEYSGESLPEIVSACVDRATAPAARRAPAR